MEIEPLKSILGIYKDKNIVFHRYLDDKTLEQIDKCIYFDCTESDLYLDDNISLVKKTTGKFYKKGKVISIDDDKITIKTNNNHLTIDKLQYYLFIKERKNKKSDRDFYKALLNQLN